MKQFGPFARHTATRRAHTQRQKETMAELVSEGWSIAAAGRHLGVNQQRASAIWQQIKRDMGAQAI